MALLFCLIKAGLQLIYLLGITVIPLNVQYQTMRSHVRPGPHNTLTYQRLY